LYKQRRISHPWKFLATLGMASLLLALPAHANKITERTKQKRAAESERAELQEKLSALKRDISQTETARSHAADELAHSEKAISDANRELHSLLREQQETEAKFKRLSDQQKQLAAIIAAQQQQLGKLLREQYVAGNEDRIKLLLSGDNPNRINRELQYMGYVSQAQAKLIDSLRNNLQAIENNRVEAQNAKDELDEIAREQREQTAQLEKEKARRATLLAQLSSKLSAQRKEAGTIERDDRRLGGLVDKLANLIEEQRKAEAVAQEKRRREQLARAERAERERARAAAIDKSKASRDAAARGRSSSPDAIDNDEPPPKTVARNELGPVASVQDGGSMGAFSALRGQLRLPVRGELLARYGSKRGDGPAWKGVFIRAPEGTEVRAVAGGQVVFSEWLRGFGNLIIIDHGNQYMTIYGNNQAVLKQAGDVVKTGEVIASAGNSGGNEQSGLYFEMRHQGRTFDPLGWINTR
jgi:septal ring factor EnvC (AmiA/AmiB activator)